MAEIASMITSTLLAQAGREPLDQPWAAGQALPFLIAGLVILAVVVWALAGGLERRRKNI